MSHPVIHSDPRIQGGVPVFFGTRVPVKNLFDYIEAGDSLGTSSTISKQETLSTGFSWISRPYPGSRRSRRWSLPAKH